MVTIKLEPGRRAGDTSTGDTPSAEIRQEARSKQQPPFGFYVSPVTAGTNLTGGAATGTGSKGLRLFRVTEGSPTVIHHKRWHEVPYEWEAYVEGRDTTEAFEDPGGFETRSMTFDEAVVTYYAVAVAVNKGQVEAWVSRKGARLFKQGRKWYDITFRDWKRLGEFMRHEVVVEIATTDLLFEELRGAEQSLIKQVVLALFEGKQEDI